MTVSGLSKDRKQSLQRPLISLLILERISPLDVQKFVEQFRFHRVNETAYVFIY